MHILRNNAMKCVKVSLRKRELPSGKITLYLDYYPPIRDVSTNKCHRHEYLGIYLLKSPKTRAEKAVNTEKLLQAEAIRAERELSILRGKLDFLDRSKLKMDFLAYFRNQLDSHDQKWTKVYDHFYNYVGGHCMVGDLNAGMCSGFREYLLGARQLAHPERTLSRNSAAGYWSTFRGLLAIAYKEKILGENINDYLDRIDTVETRREYLTLEELRRLAETPCDIPVLKNASLFSCLTGLRASDVLALEWKNIVKNADGAWCMRLRTEKTDTEATLPLSDEALSFCGEFSSGLVFKGLKKHQMQKPLEKWIKAAGIEKHITFHCFRHTFATLQVAQGTDIYTVQHLLTHKNVGTTQIYADIVDEKMRAASERIKIKDD